MPDASWAGTIQSRVPVARRNLARRERPIRHVRRRGRVRGAADSDRRQPLLRLEQNRFHLPPVAWKPVDRANGHEQSVPLDIAATGRPGGCAQARSRGHPVFPVYSRHLAFLATSGERLDAYAIEIRRRRRSPRKRTSRWRSTLAGWLVPRPPGRRVPCSRTPACTGGRVPGARTLRRQASTRGDRSRARERAAAVAGRRPNGQPRLAPRRRGDGTVSRPHAPPGVRRGRRLARRASACRCRSDRLARGRACGVQRGDAATALIACGNAATELGRTLMEWTRAGGRVSR